MSWNEENIAKKWRIEWLADQLDYNIAVVFLRVSSNQNPWENCIGLILKFSTVNNVLT